MKSILRVFGLLLLTALITVFLSACGSGDGKGGNGDDKGGNGGNGGQNGTYPGATLLQTIYTNLPTDAEHLGISYYDNALYLTGYRDNLLIKISLTTDTVESGYPIVLSGVHLPHGLVVDKDDGSIWVVDLNNHMVRHYDSSVNLIESKIVGSLPVNAAIYGDNIYVADRDQDRIFVINKSTLTIENSFAITGMNKDFNAGYIDLFIYSNKLYVVSDEFSGSTKIVKMGLDGNNQEPIMVQNEPFTSIGIYIQNDKIYLNLEQKIVITDLSGNVLNSWNFDKPAGFAGDYVDIEIVEGKIYIPSRFSKAGDTAKSHILVYSANP